MISEKQRVLPDIPGRTRSRHRKVRSTPGPPQSTAFPHGTKTQGQLHHGKRASGRHLRSPAVHRVSSRNGGTENSSTTMEGTSGGKTDGPQSTASLHGTDRPLFPAPTHESAHSPNATFLPGLTQNPGSHRPGPA